MTGGAEHPSLVQDPRTRLLKLREELRRDIASDVALLARDIDDKGEDTTVSQHPADVASDLYAREELVTEEITLEQELRQIEEALQHLSDGSYGICIDCGRGISRDRMDARPQATRCIRCQRKADG